MLLGSLLESQGKCEGFSRNVIHTCVSIRPSLRLDWIGLSFCTCVSICPSLRLDWIGLSFYTCVCPSVRLSDWTGSECHLCDRVRSQIYPCVSLRNHYGQQRSPGPSGTCAIRVYSRGQPLRAVRLSHGSRLAQHNLCFVKNGCCESRMQQSTHFDSHGEAFGSIHMQSVCNTQHATVQALRKNCACNELVLARDDAYIAAIAAIAAIEINLRL